MPCDLEPNTYNQNEYKKGGIIGISQTILGHPFDTLKTWRQNASKEKVTSKSECYIEEYHIHYLFLFVIIHFYLDSILK